MIIVLVAALAVYVVLAAVSALKAIRRFAGVTISADMRLTLYRHTIFESCAAALCLGALSLAGGMGATELGLGFSFENRFHLNEAFVIALWIGAAVAFAFACYQYAILRANPDARRRAWIQVTGSANADASPRDFYVNLLLPRDARQRQYFSLLSLSAGVCEEFIFRGVAFALCFHLFPELTAYAYLLPLITGVLFGMAHIYQGAKGILKTAAIGIFLGYVYLAAGSLIPVMILHFALDISSSHLAPDAER